MKKYKIFGPPGTGKTTYLLTLLEREFKKVHPAECAFVSFTRKGTYEGVQRATDKFNLSPQELKYFKTIHALCFSEIGARRYDMLQRSHYKQFSEAMGLRFLGYYTEDLVSNNDQYLFAEQLARNNAETAINFTRDLSTKKLAWVAANYRRFKEQVGVIDFTDLLEQYLERGEPLPVKVAFIDEAQDLTDLQWRVVNKMFSAVERLYIAGDDDQAIYEWSGADVQQFLDFEGQTKVLSKSYRLPASIHQYAACIAKEIHTRQEKKFRDNGERGKVAVTTCWRDIELDPQECTLILSRNNCFLGEAAEELQERGVVYNRKGVCSVDTKTMNAIRRYEDYRSDKVTKKDALLYSAYFKTIEEKDRPWYLVLNREADEINYYRALIASKTALDKPTVDLETIHSAKGSESDHVILMMNVTNRVFMNLRNQPDSEFRCLYVGATRAKKKLTIKLSSSRHGFPNLSVEQELLAQTYGV